MSGREREKVSGRERERRERERKKLEAENATLSSILVEAPERRGSLT